MDLTRLILAEKSCILSLGANLFHNFDDLLTNVLDGGGVIKVVDFLAEIEYSE